MKNKGFTLVELLAVIVILAIILAIAVPSISNLMNTSTKNAFESDAKMLLKQIDYKTMEDSSLNPKDITESNITTSLGLSNTNYETVSVSSLKGKPYVVLVGKNKWDGLVAYGIYTDIKITEVTNYNKVANQLGYDEDKGANEPKLAEGMKPIKWDGTKWVDTSASDTDWYDYNTKKWANARTADGSMWVWIPRYIYKITSGWHSNLTGTIEVQFSKGIDDNWNSSSIGNISTDTTANASNNTWTNHPAFDFGTTKLTGIWIAKFEASAAEGVANGYTVDGSCSTPGDDVATKTIKIAPNVTSWRCISNNNIFTASRNMETNSAYGWGTTGNGIDTHMMKNVEWGAIAYLSKSNYGQGPNEIYINNANDFTTGCAADTVSQDESTTGCLYTYDTNKGVMASTTGNIYGIYDLSGGAWEKVAAYIDNGNSNLNDFGSLILTANSKYKDVYSVGATDDQASNYALTINQKGDAVYETSNSYTTSTAWYADYSNALHTNYSWFSRGNRFRTGPNAGMFSFNNWGGININYGFRPVLVVGMSL